MTEWTVLSWNVLADCHVRPSFYPRTPPELLRTGARTAAIVDALLASGADVMCLQEADTALVEALERAFSPRGYAVHHAMKQRDRLEGCALIARDVTNVRTLVYADGAPDRADSGHIAQLAELSLDATHTVGIASTHLRWDPPGTASDARWATRQLRDLAAATRTGPWIVCGDLNVEPDDEVYAALLGHGFADPFEHDLAPTANPSGRPRRIDHLVASHELVGTPVPCPTIDELTPMPSAQFPSDHLPIAARFRFRT